MIYKFRIETSNYNIDTYMIYDLFNELFMNQIIQIDHIISNKSIIFIITVDNDYRNLKFLNNLIDNIKTNGVEQIIFNNMINCKIELN